jgi:hypothetical protein
MWDKQPVSRIIKMQNLSRIGTGVAVSTGFAPRSGYPHASLLGSISPVPHLLCQPAPLGARLFLAQQFRKFRHVGCDTPRLVEQNLCGPLDGCDLDIWNFRGINEDHNSFIDEHSCSLEVMNIIKSHALF